MRIIDVRAVAPSISSGTLSASALVLVVALGAGCSEEGAPGRTYYQRNVEPVLLQTCASNVSGCHSTNADDPHAFAAGNFDVKSFENVQKRRDLLEPFGVYPVPLLLVKAVGQSDELDVTYGDEFATLQVQHAGGKILDVGSEAYLTLLRWMENGATESGLAPSTPGQAGFGDCSRVIPGDFDPAPYVANQFFDQFVQDVQPIMQSCSSGSCHGAPQSDFYITCGDGEEALAFNFAQVQAFVDAPFENSPLLLYPLGLRSGGYFHTGGQFFDSRTDSAYEAVARWAESVGPVTFADDDPGRQFFAEYVQPLLLRRGCQFEACHSPATINDFKLRPGSQGFFSAVALERNYDLMRNDFMALEVPDVRRSRVVAKNLFGNSGGISHRGGALLETPGFNSGAANLTTACMGETDYATAPALCVLQQWLDIERTALLAAAQVLPLGAGETVPIVYVDRRDTHVAGPLAFDTYQPDSDLLVADATLDERGAITGVGGPRSLLATCPGVTDLTAVDVRGPDVRHDGKTVAFAMRTGAGDSLSIYTVGLDGQGCQRVTPAQAPVGGVGRHDFDPAWSPDGEHIVFASSRGGPDGPSVSRRLFLPQSDIWRVRADGSEPEQVTFLTNSELAPQMMREGRITMTTEKVSADFYQLAGRRINWDRTDYHPLLAQRAESPFATLDAPEETAPSVGYGQATEIREGLDGNFLLVLSDAGAQGGAGTLAVFNRSVGPFEAGRDDPGFLVSMKIPDPAATGRVGENTQGAYRSPFSLPDGSIMASYAGFAGDLGAAAALDWDIVAVNPRTGARVPLIVGPRAQVEAVLALARPPHEPYANRRQLVFGGGVNTGVTGGEELAVIHFPDVPMIFTLLNANLRRGRPVDLYRDGTHLVAYRELPAPPGTSSGGGPDGIFQDRERLGRVALARDGSARVRVPAGTGLILELQTSDGDVIDTMREEHQVGPGEFINLGISEDLFDAACGGCHGAVSGREIDAALKPDVLTGASTSLSAEESPASFD
jgi:WD40-like Beta Propeller Repeat